MKLPACGDKNCHVSNFEGTLTFGKGMPDSYGFFHTPCPICARAWEKMYPEDGECWPFEPKEDEEDHHIKGLEWLGL